MEKQRKEIKELWKQEQNKMVSIVMEFHLALCERREASAASEQLSGKIDLKVWWKLRKIIQEVKRVLIFSHILPFVCYHEILINKPIGLNSPEEHPYKYVRGLGLWFPLGRKMASNNRTWGMDVEYCFKDFYSNSNIFIWLKFFHQKEDI